MYENDSDENVEDSVSSVSPPVGKKENDNTGKGEEDTISTGATDRETWEAEQGGHFVGSERDSIVSPTPPLIIEPDISHDQLPSREKHGHGDDKRAEDEEVELLEPTGSSVSASLSHSPTHSNTPAPASEPPKKRRRGRPRKRRPSEEEEDRANSASLPHSPALSDMLLQRRGRKPRKRDRDSDSGEEEETGAMLFEYQWVTGDSGVEWYMLQEHVAEFLDIRGLQRRYPGEWSVRIS